MLVTITKYERLWQTMSQLIQNKIMQILLYQDHINIRGILLNIYTELELIVGHYVKMHP